MNIEQDIAKIRWQKNTFSETEYIRRQYVKQCLLNADGTKIPSIVDYKIYPWEKGFIPKCAVCQDMYNRCANISGKKEIMAPHKGCGCLWFNWFQDKILLDDPGITFIRPGGKR